MNNADIEARIAEIESRNLRVERSKAWEVSWLRRIAIALLTYATIVAYNLAIGADKVFVVSLVPAIGFILSTLSLSFIRKQFESKSSDISNRSDMK